ncbi:MAG TPA: Na+/H+ antiporter subunit E [Pilimelia sp.]|nr:Na+/H+ antiporter subunit E [Pilimelia sp.]
MRGVRRAGRLLRFAGYFGGRLVVANLVVAREILTPGSGLAPGIVDLPLRCRTPVETALLANLISLTPGTLTVAITGDPPTLYVHGMHAADPALFRRQLQEMEDRLLAAVRPAEDDAGGPTDRGRVGRPPTSEGRRS